MKRYLKKNDAAAHGFICSAIDGYNARFWGERRGFGYHILGGSGDIVAGVTAYMYDDCVYIDVLYVEEAHRGMGLGQQLLQKVESDARKEGRKKSFLFTYGFQAPDYYPKQGYSLLSKVENYIGGVTMYYYTKELI